jgi:hypothetical protein
VKVVGDTIWPTESNKQEYNSWAENVWIDSKAKMHGIVEVYTALLKRRNKIIKLQRPSDSVELMEPIQTHVFDATDQADKKHEPWSKDEQATISRSAELLWSRAAAIKDKRSVIALMRLLRTGRVTLRERPLEAVVDDVVRVIGRRGDATRSSGLSSEGSGWELDATLSAVIDQDYSTM